MLVISSTRNSKTLGSATAPTPRNIPSLHKEGRTQDSTTGFVSLGYGSGASSHQSGSDRLPTNDGPGNSYSSTSHGAPSARPAPWAKSSVVQSGDNTGSSAIAPAANSSLAGVGGSTASTVPLGGVESSAPKHAASRMKSWADEDSSDDDNDGGVPPMPQQPSQQPQQSAPKPVAPPTNAWNSSNTTIVPAPAPVPASNFTHADSRLRGSSSQDRVRFLLCYFSSLSLSLSLSLSHTHTYILP